MRTTPAIVRRYGVAAVAASLAVVCAAAVYAGALRPIRATLGAAETQWQTERDLIDRYKTYQRAYLDATTVTSFVPSLSSTSIGKDASKNQ
jgi:hypothetical protein